MVGYKILNAFTILNIFLKRQKRERPFYQRSLLCQNLRLFVTEAAGEIIICMRKLQWLQNLFYIKKKKGPSYLNLIWNSGSVFTIKVLSMASQLYSGHIFGATSWQWRYDVCLPNYLKTIFLNTQISGDEINHLINIASPEIQSYNIQKELILIVAQLKMREGDFL